MKGILSSNFVGRSFVLLITMIKIVLATIFLHLNLISANPWPGRCPGIKYPPLVDGWRGALSLWQRAAQSSNPLFQGDPKISGSGLRFEHACEVTDRPWFIMSEIYAVKNSTKSETRYAKVEPYTWANQPGLWFMDIWDVGSYRYEMLDIAEDEQRGGKEHDEHGILFTREYRLSDSKKKYLEGKMKNTIAKNGLRFSMEWLI